MFQDISANIGHRQQLHVLHILNFWQEVQDERGHDDNHDITSERYKKRKNHPYSKTIDGKSAVFLGREESDHRAVH